jgi:hypothetical protein
MSILIKHLIVVLLVTLLPMTIFAQTEQQRRKEILSHLVAKIEKIKNVYPHFRDFDAQKAVTDESINYVYGMQEKPNPNYKKLKRRQEKLERQDPGRMRPGIPRMIPTYSQDGIYLNIRLYTKKEGGQRVLPPYGIGNFYVDFIMDGLETEAITKIRREINEILETEGVTLR